MAQNKDLVADAQTLLEENLSEKKSVVSRVCTQASPYKTVTESLLNFGVLKMSNSSKQNFRI